MKKALTEFLQRADTEVSAILDHISAGTLFSSDTFDSPVITTEAPECGSPLRGRNGVYIFILTADIDLTYDDVKNWCTACQGAPFERWEPQELHTGDCFYVGSATSESLYSRLRSHINGDGEHTSLNLSVPARQKLKPILKVYAYPIKKCFNEEMIRIVLTVIEKRLHQQLHPITGKSKV